MTRNTCAARGLIIPSVMGAQVPASFISFVRISQYLEIPNRINIRWNVSLRAQEAILVRSYAGRSLIILALLGGIAASRKGSASSRAGPPITRNYIASLRPCPRKTHPPVVWDNASVQKLVARAARPRTNVTVTVIGKP